MADIFSYNQQFSTIPGLTFVGGTIGLASDGYTVSGDLPLEIAELVHDGTGLYTINLTHCWNDLLVAVIQTVLPTGSSPAYLDVQILENNVGEADTVDGEQGVSFSTVIANGTATDMDGDGAFQVLLVLKNSSA